MARVIAGTTTDAERRQRQAFRRQALGGGCCVSRAGCKPVAEAAQARSLAKVLIADARSCHRLADPWPR